MLNLQGKRILITGAASGIGWEAAKLAATAGATVVGVSRREGRLRQLASEVLGIAALPLDLEASRSIETLQGEVRFDAIVCNAGRGCTTMPLEVRFELVEAMMRANVLTVMNTLEGCLPKMREAGKGSVVIVGSVLARVPTAPWRAAYSASKAALAALVAGWRQELRKEGIAVKFVCPGLTATEFQSVANPGSKPVPTLSSKAMQPQTAAEVAQVVLEAIDSDKDEIYTRPETAQWMASVYASLSQGTDPLRDALV